MRGNLLIIIIIIINRHRDIVNFSRELTMDEESDSYDSGKEKRRGVKHKKVRYCNKYSVAFESDPIFKGWIKASTKGDQYAYCIPCDNHLKLSAGKTDLKRHAEKKKHKDAAKAVQNQRPINNMFNLTVNESKVNEAELRLAAFITEHDLPMTVADHLPQLVNAMCPDSKIAKEIKCARTKVTALINHVTGEENKAKLINHLKENKFSLIVDESTDKGCIKHLCMVARVMVENDVKDCFLGLIPLKDATAASLYNHVVEFFSKHNIPYKENLIGFAADGANSMLGERHSLSSLLKKDIPHLFVMKCICHSFALCASYACLKLPRSLEDLARNIYSYFHCSPKRMGDFEEFQKFVHVKPHKLLHPSQTRWLSLEMVVSRLLEQYEALKLYFTNAVLGDRLTTPEIILERLSHPVTKLYLLFLEYVLPVFNNLNRQMQSESTQVHVLYNSVTAGLKTILGCYIEQGYLNKTDLTKIQFRDPGKFLPLEQIYLGVKVALELRNSTYDMDEVKRFRLCCLDFYIEASSQIFKRFNFDCMTIVKSLNALSPKVVIAKEMPSIIELISSFRTIATDIQAIDTEWRLLGNSLDSMNVNPDMMPQKFWCTVSLTRQSDNSLMFPNLAVFMQTLLSLPHSSATVERIFSAINRMKTKTRNKLSTETITGLLHTKQLIKGACCYDFNDEYLKYESSFCAVHRQDFYGNRACRTHANCTAKKGNLKYWDPQSLLNLQRPP
ncbi:protein FAM200C-like [Palaemon carinicauda]|uniref:protein FAM200C-like n=1 Tax=Palaemon carinicauda TaxID=392227 RepID=UPI0035B5CDE8